MPHSEPTPFTRAADRAQREADHQRWADDGGKSPESPPDSLPPSLPEMPTRLVYRRGPGRILGLQRGGSRVSSSRNRRGRDPPAC